RLGGCVHGLLDLAGADLVHLREDVVFVVRHDGLEGRAGLDLLAADDGRDLELLALHLVEALFELGALGRAWGVVLDGLVLGRGRLEDRGSAHAVILRFGRCSPKTCGTSWRRSRRSGSAIGSRRSPRCATSLGGCTL